MNDWFTLLAKSLGSRLYLGIFWAYLTLISGVALLMLSGWFITATALAGLAISASIVILFDMYMPGSGIRFFALSRTVGRYIERVYNHDSILRLIAVFRTKLFAALSNLSIQELQTTSDSEWLSRLTADLDALDSILLRYTIPSIAALLMCLTLTFFASFYWFDLALYLGIFMLLCLFITIGFTVRHTKAYAGAISSLLNDSRAHIIEHLQGAVELQSYNLMQAHEASLLDCLDAFYQTQNALNTKVANIQLILDIALGLVAIALVYLTFVAINIEKIDGAVAVMFIMMFVAAAEILQSFPGQFSSWGKTYYSANRLSHLIDNGKAQLQHETTPRHVSQTYSALQKISKIEGKIDQHPKIAASQIKPISFALEKGQILNVRGRSGSGKSTFANIIMGIEQIEQSSHVLINAKLKLSEINLSDWCNEVSYLTQSNAVMSGSLIYNLTLGIDDVSESEVWSALQAVELDSWAKNLAQGLNTWLGETGGKVSGGQARRICLARILLRNPQLIILDEPFNGIDDIMATRIWKNISPWMSRRMGIILTHEAPHYLLPTKDDGEHTELAINLNIRSCP